jgi:hypothetical protein
MYVGLTSITLPFESHYCSLLAWQQEFYNIATKEEPHVRRNLGVGVKQMTKLGEN